MALKQFLFKKIKYWANLGIVALKQHCTAVTSFEPNFVLCIVGNRDNEIV